MTPAQLLASAHAGGIYQLSGRVVSGSVARQGERLRFRVADRRGGASVPVTYAGTIPDPFREGREVIVTGRWAGGQFIGQRDSLITKCPSKFQNAPAVGR
jgi:cytochrome c-type biogenesis protein CcmE